MDTIVGFCIPTYNRKNMVYELVDNLLSMNNENFEIIILDNCSSDGTLELLDTINDQRLKTYAQTEPVAPLQNMFDCLCLTSAKWIVQLNDQDTINVEYVEVLIDSLIFLETQNVAFAVSGEQLSQDLPFTIIKSGKDAINEFAIRDYRTTGHIIRKDCWDNILDKQTYFSDTSKYGFYPHGYIYAILGQQYNGAYIHFDITDLAHSDELLSTENTSSFYGANTNQNEWFCPESRYNLLMYSIQHLHLIKDSGLYADYLLSRYMRTFHQATYDYFSLCQNEKEKRRNKAPFIPCSRIEALKNGYAFSAKFNEYLQTTTPEWCSLYFIKKLVELDSQLISDLLSWESEPLRLKRTAQILNETNNPMISIVMPIFNRPDFLSKALSSLYAQTYRNFEIICVNDGSTDAKIINMLEKYRKEHSNFSYHTTEKKGAGHARNYGFQFVKGKYTIFLDSDDIFDQSMLEKLIIMAETSDSEITFCNYIPFVEAEGKYMVGNQIYGATYASMNDRNDEAWIQNMITNPWSKMFLSSFLKTNNIIFQEVSSANDVAFSVISNILAKKYAFVDENPLVYYRISDNQITSTKKSTNAISVVKYIQDNLEQRNILSDSLQHQLNVFYIFFILDEIRSCKYREENSITLKYLLERLVAFPIEFKNEKLKNYLDNLLIQLTELYIH